jgi:hypothetical protein
VSGTQSTTDSIQKKEETQGHFKAVRDEWGDAAKDLKEHLYGMLKELWLREQSLAKTNWSTSSS